MNTAAKNSSRRVRSGSIVVLTALLMTALLFATALVVDIGSRPKLHHGGFIAALSQILFTSFEMTFKRLSSLHFTLRNALSVLSPNMFPSGSA